ncbi:MAG TPA: GNAT family acetyltransferase [Caulobacteraceae bacterium]|nr:GNAT family acetyltransferase [Caulobacteraceae bacterium]
MAEQSPVEVREIEDADFDAVVEVWRLAGVARPWNDPATDVAFCRKSPHATILVGTTAGRLVATAMVGEDGHRGWVYYVATRPDLQRGGIGRTMMQAAEDWLRARGIWKLQLLVRADNAAAKGFYERLGYHDTGSVCLQKAIGPATVPAKPPG